ncbi:hypothetical protein C2845_PM10G11430 [Panicum miliaceum]|uniref:Uncharacterized protein n=1 Tax=Panicum miliaceum TaxID=4540 RepID=A0A3L6PCN6_PANMI|nr:hypothetical protein C2845_PM10G11430 [Panicum miliaceum]
MATTRETAGKSTRGPPRQIQHPQEVPAQGEPVQPEDALVVVEINDDDDNYYSYYGGGWVDIDTKEEPMELLEDHPDAVEDNGEEDGAGGDGADLGAAGGDDAEDGGDDPAAPDGGDDDPDDDPEPAIAADVTPPEPHHEKQIHHLDFAEGPFPVLLWRAMQRIGFPLMPRYEASLFKNAQQEEKWLVAVVISVPDERRGLGSQEKLRKTLREKVILEAQLNGDQELPPEYDSDESIDYLPESPPRKRVLYGEPGYRTRYR